MKFNEEKQSLFQRKFGEAMNDWEEFFGQALSMLKACNENREFHILEFHFRHIEDLAKKIRAHHSFLLHVLPPLPQDPTEVETIEVQKCRVCVSFLDRSSDTLMCQVMNAYRPWLRVEHLRRGLEEEAP